MVKGEGREACTGDLRIVENIFKSHGGEYETRIELLGASQVA